MQRAVCCPEAPLRLCNCCWLRLSWKSFGGFEGDDSTACWQQIKRCWTSYCVLSSRIWLYIAFYWYCHAHFELGILCWNPEWEVWFALLICHALFTLFEWCWIYVPKNGTKIQPFFNTHLNSWMFLKWCNWILILHVKNVGILGQLNFVGHKPTVWLGCLTEWLLSTGTPAIQMFCVAILLFPQHFRYFMHYPVMILASLKNNYEVL